MSTERPHARGNRKGLASIFGMVTLNVSLILFLVHSTTVSSTTQTAQSPAVSVAEQQDAPLTISVKGHDVSDPSAPQVKYKVQNISNKAVRAYTILEELMKSNGGRVTGGNVVNFSKEPKFLRPTQTRIETCDLSSPGDPVTGVTLVVDYVEFGDGTTWGKDTRRSAEYLAGQREGWKGAIKKIQEIREREGDYVVEELLRIKDGQVASPSAGHSAEWEYGFRVGHNSALHQLRTAHMRGGVRALVSELEKELDGVEGRKR